MVYAYSIYVRRGAAAAAAYENYNAYITVTAPIKFYKCRAPRGPDLLPKRRFLELTLHGNHLATASARMSWADSLRADLANAFGITSYIETHMTLTASATSGVNNSTLSVRFAVKPLLSVAVNRTTFFATNGTASWISRCQSLHTTAAAEDLGIIPVCLPEPVPGGVALDAVPKSESELMVTGTAPGDESLTDVPAPTNAPGSVTNAPGDAAPRVATAAVL
jgi:hypothetical protein